MNFVLYGDDFMLSQRTMQKKPAKSSKDNGQICPVLFHCTHRATRERTHLYTVYVVATFKNRRRLIVEYI
jgi:hypothetical protein